MRKAVTMAMLASGLVGLTGVLQARAHSGDGRRAVRRLEGHKLYVAKGCYECHGLGGQGAVGVAPPLAPPRLTAAAMERYVRHPAGIMPPYSAHLVSSADLAAIWAYLASLPTGRTPQQIAALRPYVLAAALPSGVSQRARAVVPPPSPPDGGPPALAGGGALYRNDCAGCHGAHLEGAGAPGLRPVGERASAAQVAAIIMSPRRRHAASLPRHADGRPGERGRRLCRGLCPRDARRRSEHACRKALMIGMTRLWS